MGCTPPPNFSGSTPPINKQKEWEVLYPWEMLSPTLVVSVQSWEITWIAVRQKWTNWEQNFRDG